MKRPESPSAWRGALIDALETAGRILRRHFLRGGKVVKKGPVDLVTIADRQADREIVRRLRRRFPDHDFLTEEFMPAGRPAAAKRRRWIIDPLDGTTNYAHGYAHACVSVAMEENGAIRIGGIYDPFKREMFLAERGKGAYLNGRRIRVSRTPRLIDGLLVTGFPYDRQKRARFYLSFYERLLKRTQGIRRLGAAALDLAYVACGRFDAYWEFNLKPWDVAAGWLIAEEAGGRVTDFRGRKYALTDTGQTLCSNGRLHESILRVLRVGLNRRV
jgi:myo-inositol-1(or 4)-monophosphatase